MHTTLARDTVLPLAADRMGRGSAALGAFKAALRQRGVIEHAVTAPPQVPLADNEIDTIRAALAAAGYSR